MNAFVNSLPDGVLTLGFGKLIFRVREKRRRKGGWGGKESRMDETNTCTSPCVIPLRTTQVDAHHRLAPVNNRSLYWLYKLKARITGIKQKISI